MKKKQNHTKVNWILILIVLVAFFLRSFRLDSIPPSPYWEEVAIGYDAYSIAATGKDHHGNSYPLLSFPSYGDYKPPFYFYLVAPFTKIFGLSMWAVRLPSALAGVLSVVFLYLIGKELEEKKLGLIAAGLLAIQPWSLQFSRGGFEVTVATLLVVSGAYCFLKSRSHPWWVLGGSFLFALSMYTYHAARLFAPLAGLLIGSSLLVYWWKTNRIRQALPAICIGFLIAAIFTIPLAVNIGNKQVSGRFAGTTLLSATEPVAASNAMQARYGHAFWAKVVFHRYWFLIGTFFQSWVSHFSPIFLFVQGDGNLRHGVVKVGMLYWFEVISILSALWVGIRRRSFPILGICLWIACAAVPPAFVMPTPHTLRFLLAAPAFSLLSAYGFVEIYRRVPSKRRNVFIALTGLLIFGCLAYYLRWYYGGYSNAAAADWQYGYKEMYEVVAREKKIGEQVFIERNLGRPAMYYLYYTHYDPRIIQSKDTTLPKDQLEYIQVDDFHFVEGLPSPPGLYITPPGYMPHEYSAITTIRRPDGSVIWDIWRR